MIVVIPGGCDRCDRSGCDRSGASFPDSWEREEEEEEGLYFWGRYYINIRFKNLYYMSIDTLIEQT